jgi:hypothetical protein
MLRIFGVLCLIAAVAPAALRAQPFAGGFPFYLPAYDSSAQAFLPAFPRNPIDEADRVSAAGGQFMAGGAPIRFWGVNITAAACFPPPDQAPLIAARMRKMGINLVRFHHLDNPSWGGANSSIFLSAETGTRTLNPTTLDRLDYFIAQLKAEGIYVNMNLNVSRTFRAADGVVAADSLADFGKGPTLFDPQMQALQREYARQLLMHVNPYTGMSLAADPVLAMVEMNNENSLYGMWKSDALEAIANGGLLPAYYNDQLDQLWLDFLWARYGSPDALADAWNAGAGQGSGAQLMVNPGFETGAISAPWTLEQHDQAAAALSADAAQPAAGAYCARLEALNLTGTDWHLQFKQNQLSLQADTLYELRFWARASTARSIGVSVMQDGPPYNWYTGANLWLTPQWTEYAISFALPEDVGNGRISISPQGEPATFWFDEFRLGPPIRQGLAPDESLADGQIARLLWTSRFSYTPARVADQAAFYIALQKAHFDALRTYLRDTVGVTAPITGTNALVGPADAAQHEDLDYVDDHSYWDHPWFPGIAWDPANWLIANQPQVYDPGLSAVASAFSGVALANKPFTLSEYNHGAPNRYRVEMPHLLAAYSALHGVDGIMFFEYNGNNDWSSDVVNGFFSLHRDNSVTALFPAFARAFRAGLLQADPDPLRLRYSAADLGAQPFDDNGNRWQKYTPYDRRLALTRGIVTESYSAAAGSGLSHLPQPGQPPYATSTGETYFDPEAGLLSSSAPGMAAITGFLAQAVGQNINNQLEVMSAAEFGALAWVSVTDAPLSLSSRSLLTLSSAQQNTNMQWDGAQTVHNNWGQAPTLQRPLALRLRLRIEADFLRIYPLSPRGEAGAYTQWSPIAPGLFEVDLDQAATPTLWFGIEALGGNITSSAQSPEMAPLALSVSPNPARAGDLLQLRGAGSEPDARWMLFDESGRQAASGTGANAIALPLQLAPGHYRLQLVAGGRQGICSLIVVK